MGTLMTRSPEFVALARDVVHASLSPDGVLDLQGLIDLAPVLPEEAWERAVEVALHGPARDMAQRADLLELLVARRSPAEAAALVVQWARERPELQGVLWEDRPLDRGPVRAPNPAAVRALIHRRRQALDSGAASLSGPFAQLGLDGNALFAVGAPVPPRALRWRFAQLTGAEQHSLSQGLFDLLGQGLPDLLGLRQGWPRAGGADPLVEVTRSFEAAPTAAGSWALRSAPLPQQGREPRVVSTGFSSPAQPGQPRAPLSPLRPEEAVLFWLEVGAPVGGSIETEPGELPASVPAEALLQVVLFGFPGELQLEPGATVGELQLRGDSPPTVVRQPASTAAPCREATRRLFFSVRVPAGVAPGATLRLRCNLYCKQVLLQSRLVLARVGPGEGVALRSVLDYSIDRALDGGALAALTPHRLSVFFNGGEDGSHNFRFYGSDGSRPFQHETTLDAGTLQTLVRQARGALQQVAWGDEGPWLGERGQQRYRYQDPQDVGGAQLRADLALLAVRGSRIYVSLARDLAGDATAAWDLAALMREPGFVQIATKVAAYHEVPAALLYDQPLDDSRPLTDYSLCPAFLAAAAAGTALEAADCFRGRCPSYKLPTVVCPSGFWGYRHFLGMPLARRQKGPLKETIDYQVAPQMVVGVSLAPTLHERPAHEQALRALRPDLQWRYGDSAARIVDLLQHEAPHVVYFYCHGVTTQNLFYLQVGQTDAFTPTMLFTQRIRWESPRPLVFINGCGTTSLSPGNVLDFVSEFVESSNAVGVIGTEITVFEPLARRFAEECLRRFLAGTPIGQAVRAARLVLLQQGNPLGLVYDPFVLGSVTLVRAAA